MGDDDARRQAAHLLLQVGDGGDVEVVRRFVEQQQVGLQREGERQRRALALAARARRRWRRVVEAEAVQVLDQPGLDAPALALVGDAREVAALREALAQRGRLGQQGLLLDVHDARAIARAHLAVVERHRSGDDAEQRRFAGAVATDQADALAVGDDELRTIEQRMQAEREFRVLKRDERHERSITASRRRARGCAVGEPGSDRTPPLG